VGKSSTINILLEVAAVAAEQEHATTGDKNVKKASGKFYEPEGTNDGGDGAAGGGGRNVASNLASRPRRRIRHS
jgi:hypothetical protein